MPKKVKVDGRIIVVPDDATPDEIDAIANPGKTPEQPKAAPAPTFAERHPIIAGAGDVAIGAAKGLGNTLNNVGSMLYPDFIAKHLTGVPSEQQQKEYFAPKNTAQAIGKGAEQIGEFLVPTGAEAEVASQVGKLAPKIAKYAVPAAKFATNAVETGLRTKAQGGSFTSGAEAGLAGSVVSPIAKKAAQGLAEIAVAPGKRLLKSIPEDVDIGKTVLDESTGIRPRTIAKQLGDKVAQHSAAEEDALTEAAKKGKSIPLGDARNIVAEEEVAAASKNSPSYLKDVGKVRDQLAYQYGENGRPLTKTVQPMRQGAGFRPVEVPGEAYEAPIKLPSHVTPMRARAIRQGIDTEIGNWNPEAQSAIKPLQKRVYGAITGKIHEAVPAAAEHDAAMTNLIPAQEAAWNTAFNPGVARSVFARIARPTGALAGGIAGGYEGYKRGGAEGAVLGSTIGLTVPELITSPTGQMIVARGISNPMVGRFVKGAALRALPDEEQPTQ